MRRTVVKAAALVIAAALTATGAGCSSGGLKNESTAVMTVGKVGAPTLPDNMNIMSPTSQWWSLAGGTLVYEPLLRFTATLGEPEGWLAESWEFSEDGKELTLELRDDVTFSDGSKFTVEDAVYSLELAQEPQAAKAPFYTEVVAGDGAVTLRSDKPMFTALSQLASIYMVPKKLWSAQKDVWTWTNPEPVGTGPGVLESASPQKMSYQVRDDYWGGELPAQKIDVVPVSPAAMLTQVERGEIDFVHAAGIPQATIADFLKTEGTGAFTSWAGGGIRATFNTTRPPLDDVNVRRALRDAMDMDEVAALEGTEDPVTNEIGLSLELDGLTPEFSAPAKPAVERAKAALAASGYTVRDGNLSKGGKDYPITIQAYAPGLQSVSTKGAQGVAQQWESVLGIKAQVSQTERANTERIFREKSYDVVMQGTATSSIPQSVAGIAQNTDLTGFTDPKLTELYDQISGIPTDDPAYAELSAQIQQRLAEVVPWGVGLESTMLQFTSDENWTNWEEAFEGMYPNEAFGTEFVTFMKKLKPAGA